jgi:hypothetical protein
MDRRLEKAQVQGVRNVKPGRPVRSITDSGPPDIGHSWAYLPDVGETIALRSAARC